MPSLIAAFALSVLFTFVDCRSSPDEPPLAPPTRPVAVETATVAPPSMSPAASPSTPPDASTPADAPPSATVAPPSTPADAPPRALEDAAGAAPEDGVAAGDAPRGDDGGAPDDGVEAEPETLEELAPLSAGTGPLEARLKAEIGAGLPVAILPTPIGLAAMSSDGSRGALLTSGEVLWALVDDYAHVVWYGTASGVAGGEDEQSAIRLLDLTADEARPRLIAKGLDRYAEVEVVYRDPRTKRTSTVSWPTARYGVRIDVIMDARRPRLEAGGGVYADLGIADGKANARAVRKAQPDAATRELLRELAARAERSFGTSPPAVAPKVPPAPAPPARIAVPAACENPDDCGATEAFANTPYWIVVVAQSCGDACYRTRQLYDPARRVYVSAENPELRSVTPLSPTEDDVRGALVAADGSAFVMFGRIYRIGHWPVEPPLPAGAGPLTATGGGWLGGQWSVW